MGIRVGKVIEVEAPPGGKQAILRVTLNKGGRVYVPTSLVSEPFDPEHQYIFVERGRLGRTEWYGTWEDIPAAIQGGFMTSAEAQSMGYTAEGYFDVSDADAVVRNMKTSELGKPPAQAASGCMSTLTTIVAALAALPLIAFGFSTL